MNEESRKEKVVARGSEEGLDGIPESREKHEKKLLQTNTHFAFSLLSFSLPLVGTQGTLLSVTGMGSQSESLSLFVRSANFCMRFPLIALTLELNRKCGVWCSIYDA